MTCLPKGDAMDKVLAELSDALGVALVKRDEEYNPKRADQSAGWFRAHGIVRGLEQAIAIVQGKGTL